MEDKTELLKMVPYGVFLMTTKSGDTINGMPLSWVTQVSFDPPLVAVAVHPTRYSHKLIKESGSFCINYLRPTQTELVNKFKNKGEDTSKKFDGLKITDSPLGFPVLEDALGYLDCEVKTSYEPGDHTIFIAEIKGAKLLNKDRPMTEKDFGPDYGYGG